MLHEGAHEAILDQTTWDQVQGLIAGRRKDAQPRRRSKNAALLQGLVRCGVCGSAMTPRHSKKGTKRYHYYTCTRIQKSGAAACPG